MLVPVRLRPADPAEAAAATARFRDGGREPADLRLLTKHTLALLVAEAPGGAVEIRVPPYAAAQAIPGTRHTRGTPPAVVETDAETWVALALGDLSWAEAVERGKVAASGERSDLSGYVPVGRARGSATSEDPPPR